MTSSQQLRQILIVGAGIGGLTLAHALLRRGITASSSDRVLALVLLPCHLPRSSAARRALGAGSGRMPLLLDRGLRDLLADHRDLVITEALFVEPVRAGDLLERMDGGLDSFGPRGLADNMVGTRVQRRTRALPRGASR